jgi:steroid delta-isomerase-like uncharacterized protein
MSTEENKAIGPRFLKEQDRLKGVPGDELCAPNYTAYINGNPPMDRAGHEQMAHIFFGAFPDLNQTVEETVAEGDKVVVRFTARGTHTGELMGIPATNKSITVGGIAIFRVVNGKVVEVHEVFDEMSLMQQLGVIPT